MKTHNWKSNYFSTLETEIDKIKEEGHYRVFNNIERKAGQYPKATRHHEGNTEEIDVWCSNDYLGCLLYTSPSPRDMRRSRMPSSA